MLEINPRSALFKPEIHFRGMGYTLHYSVEEYATCGENETHDVPDSDCGCGFWLPDGIENVASGQEGWLLDVELAGEVIEHEQGWRGQWQRVLSVTPPLWCMICTTVIKAPATCITVSNPNYRITAMCVQHAGKYAVPRPVSWLRSLLRTELRPGFLSDDLVPVPPPAPAAPAIDQAMLAKIIDAAVSTAVRAASAETPHLAQGHHWRHYIPSGKAGPAPLMLDMATTSKGLVLQLLETDPGGIPRVLWTENMSL